MKAKDELRGTKRFVMTSKEIGNALGIGPAILLHAIDDFMQIFEKAEAGAAEPKHYRDGRWWVWNSYKAWEENIEVLDARTIERYMVWLESTGIILTSQDYNDTPYDRTKWYTIDYETLDYFLEAWHGYGMPRRSICGKQPPERQQFEDDWVSRTNGLITPPWGDDHATVAPSDHATVAPSEDAIVASPIPETPETTREYLDDHSGRPADPMLQQLGKLKAATVQNAGPAEDEGDKVTPDHSLAQLIMTASNSKSLTAPQWRRLNDGPREVLFFSSKNKRNETATVPSLVDLWDSDPSFVSYAERRVGYLIQKIGESGKRPSRTQLIDALYEVGRQGSGWLNYQEEKLHRLVVPPAEREAPPKPVDGVMDAPFSDL